MSAPLPEQRADEQQYVPLTVWLGETTPPPGLSPSTLLRAIALFSQPNEAIVTIDGPPGVHAAADYLHRRLHTTARHTGTGMVTPAGGSFPCHTAGLVIDYQPDMVDATVDDFPDPFLADYIHVRGILRPGGIFLVVIAPVRPQLDGLARTITAARGAGLRYLQHIVVVTAPVTDDRLAPPVAGLPVDGRFLIPVHTDLAVFTTSGGRRA
ncbi:hypothetical protein [Frankia sp. CiP3]|uniref:hypothetical protein n=1 Tax=Frankia sp. CiP3 TaxID=2880971 RepID=UPI001EF5E76C|nr:hypothetical protein [Frankia sp. CiP3]